MAWRRIRVDERDRVDGDYSALIPTLTTLRSLLRSEAASVDADWSHLHASFFFLRDGVRAGIAVDDVRFTALRFPPELFATLTCLKRATEPAETAWRTARVIVHRVGYVTVDFFEKNRAYRVLEWLNIPPRGWEREFARLAAGRLLVEGPLFAPVAGRLRDQDLPRKLLPGRR